MAKELAHVADRQALKSPKSALQEAVQGKGYSVPSYRTVKVTGQDHAREFTVEVVVDGKVLGTGIGKRKAFAEQEAAKEALTVFGEKY